MVVTAEAADLVSVAAAVKSVHNIVEQSEFQIDCSILQHTFGSNNPGLSVTERQTADR